MIERYLVTTAADRAYGVPLRQLVGVEPVARIVPLPHVPPWLLGATYRMGRVLSVIDLSTLLGSGTGSTGPGRAGRLLVTGDADTTVALAVESVDAVVDVDLDRIVLSHPSGQSEADRFTDGQCTQGTRPFGLLNVNRLLQAPELQLRM